MPPLNNPRHERFVQALFQGKPATKAYEEAGYRSHQGNSSRLRWYEMVQTRLADLQREAQKASEVTVESLLAELEEARAKATSLDQLSAAVRAIEGKAKISGVLIERQQIEVTAPDPFEDAESIDEILDYVARETDLETAKLLARAFGITYSPTVDLTPRAVRRSQRLIEEQRPGHDRKREI